jgi:CHAT domain-containing protein
LENAATMLEQGRDYLFFEKVDCTKQSLTATMTRGAAVLTSNLIAMIPEQSVGSIVIATTFTNYGKEPRAVTKALLADPALDIARLEDALRELFGGGSTRWVFQIAELETFKVTTGFFGMISLKARGESVRPVRFPEKDNLNDLPGTETEVNTISKLFQSKNIPNRIFLNNQANETEIKSGKLKDYSLIHFATHGIVDETSPELSRIYLQSDSEAEDGNLFAGEIYNLQLNANLVSLSACQTGLGKISKGEGVIGLSRALVYAGAKNIIVSFWSVADESTAELMTDFYKYLLENPSASYSSDLRQAKLGMLNSKYASPYYWAPFILIGF